MGYSRTMNMEHFSFKDDVTPKILLEQFNKYLCKNGYRAVEIPPERKWRTAREAFRAWGFSFDAETMEIDFVDEYLGDEDEMLKVLAPFVKADSYIDSNDDFGECRLKFDGMVMTRVEPDFDFDKEKVKKEIENCVVCRAIDDDTSILNGLLYNLKKYGLYDGEIDD